MSKLILKGANIVWTGMVGRGGHIMYALQWLHGLRLLAHEVLYYTADQNGLPTSVQSSARYCP